jgi:hypothetical protein
LAQLALGIYLKLHIHEQTIRPWAVVLHGIIGKSWLVIGWTQMLFGVVVLRGYCGVSSQEFSSGSLTVNLSAN